VLADEIEGCTLVEYRWRRDQQLEIIDVHGAERDGGQWVRVGGKGGYELFIRE